LRSDSPAILFVGVLAIVAFDAEAEFLHQPNQPIETWTRQFVVDRHEIQILADAMSEVEGDGRSANESKALQACLPGKKLPNAFRLRRQLAGIHGEYS
jgi:hypothetical protein